MRNILALVGAAVVAFLAAGWYLGWYQVSSKPTSHGEQAVHVDINSTKITEDVKKGVERGSEFVDSLRSNANEPKPAQPGPATNFFTPASTTNEGAANRVPRN